MRPGLLKGEWGQGSWYTGPSPLGDSPAVILCLDEPLTSLVLLLFLPSPHLRSLLRSLPTHPPTPPALNLILLLLVLWWGWKPWFQPIPCQNASISKGHLKRRPFFSFFKSPFDLYWEAAVVVHPCPGTPHPPDARSSASQKENTHTHTLVNYHGSFQSPLMVTNRVQKLLGLKRVCLFFLTFYYCCMLTLCLFNGSHWERSDIRTIQSMAA